MRNPRESHQDPIEIPRDVLRNHLADLDEVFDFIASLGELEIESLIDGVLRCLHGRIFANLPEG